METLVSGPQIQVQPDPLLMSPDVKSHSGSASLGTHRSQERMSFMSFEFQIIICALKNVLCV